MVQVDGSVIIQIINFIFLIWALNYVLYRPVRTILLQRKENVEGSEQKINMLNRDAIEKQDEYLLGIKTAKADGLKEKNSLLLIAAEEEDTIISEIHAKAKVDLDRIRGKIAKDVQSVSDVLQNEIDVFAKAIGEKILGRVV